MARRLPLLGEQRLSELEAAWKSERRDWARQRLRVIRMVARHQHSAQEIAEALGVSRPTVFNYLKAFVQKGVEGLLHRGYGIGRPGVVEGKVREELIEKLRAGEFSRAKDVQRWVRKRTGCTLSLKTLYYHLGKVGGVLRVPRKTHVKKDAAQVEAFRQEAADRLLAMVEDRRRPVRLWVVDEHRYGLLPVIRRCWGLRGVRVHAPYATKYQWGYLYEALEVDGANAMELLFSPRVGKDVSNLFLRQLADTDADAVHLVVWDQAGFHPKDGEEGVPENVRLLPLPAYSPELNPVEKLGDMVKDAIANRLFTQLADLEAAILEELEPLRTGAHYVRQLLGQYSIVSSANACGRNSKYKSF
jgi:transposase